MLEEAENSDFFHAGLAAGKNSRDQVHPLCLHKPMEGNLGGKEHPGLLNQILRDLQMATYRSGAPTLHWLSHCQYPLPQHFLGALLNLNYDRLNDGNLCCAAAGITNQDP